jgi:hypothetical protein
MQDIKVDFGVHASKRSRFHPWLRQTRKVPTASADPFAFRPPVKPANREGSAHKLDYTASDGHLVTATQLARRLPVMCTTVERGPR